MYLPKKSWFITFTQQEGYCCVEYQVCASVINAFSLQIKSTIKNAGDIDSLCTQDYVVIPGWESGSCFYWYFQGIRPCNPRIPNKIKGCPRTFNMPYCNAFLRRHQLFWHSKMIKIVDYKPMNSSARLHIRSSLDNTDFWKICLSRIHNNLPFVSNLSWTIQKYVRQFISTTLSVSGSGPSCSQVSNTLITKYCGPFLDPSQTATGINVPVCGK